MFLKLVVFYLVAVFMVSTQTQEVNEFPGSRLRSFTDDSGISATERVVDMSNGNRQFIVIPKQRLSDRTTVYHNTEKGITIYKDQTYGVCFLSSLNPDILHTNFLMFKYQPMTKPNGDVFEMVTYGSPVEDIEEIGDETVTGLCAGLPIHRIKPANPHTRSKRGISISGSATVSVDSKGRISASGSFGKGSHSSSASSSGDAGKGGRSVSVGGSVSVGRGGVRSSVSGRTGERSSSRTSASDGRTSSSSSSGRSSSSGGARTSSSSTARDSSRRSRSSSSRRGGGGRRGGGRRGGW